MRKINVIILAAGKGTRMFSAKPKVLHEIAGRSLLQHTLDTAAAINASTTHIVIGHEAELIRQALTGKPVEIVLQEQQLGTAHAVHQALEQLDKTAIALVLYADVPLIKTETLQRLLQCVDANSMAVLTCVVTNPLGLGRILRDNDQNICAIIEDKETTAEQKQIKEINTGVMAIPVARLYDWLPRISANNSQSEYYLTDLVSLALADGCKVSTVQCKDEFEASGVNNRVQLAELERHYQKNEATRLMLAGVTLRDPMRVDFRGHANISADVDIDINVILEGDITIARNVYIGPNCLLKNCVIGEGTIIAANSVIEDAVIGKKCNIGPFARIRPGTALEDAVKVGNFVEIKNSTIGKHSKVNHLSYVGDSTLGDYVNVGAGTITCNYDGVNKFKTVIGDNVFIGSNTALVAPVTIAAGATIGAGSVITKNVDKDQLAVARGRQANMNGWQRPQKTIKSHKE